MPRGWTRALALLLLIPCFVAVYDGVIVFASWHRLNRAAAALSDEIAHAAAPAEADFAGLFADAQTAAQPDDVTRAGGIVVSAIGCGEDGGTVLWQRRAGGGAASRYGPAGAQTTAPAPCGTLIGAELAAPVSPWVLGGGWLQRALPGLLRVVVLRRAA